MAQSKSAAESLLDRDREWAEAAREGKDIDLILSYWTDDAVVMPSGQATVTGKQELRDYVAASLAIPGFQISWESDRVEFSPDGNLAYMFSRNNVKFNTSDGTSVNSSGRALTIWRRETDGVWRCVVDIWNSAV